MYCMALHFTWFCSALFTVVSGVHIVCFSSVHTFILHFSCFMYSCVVWYTVVLCGIPSDAELRSKIVRQITW